MIIFVHFYFPFSVHCYIIIYKRRIRKQKYFYQPNDLVKYDGKVYTVKGTQNEGKYIALKEIKKVPKVELLILYVFKKGLNWSYGLC